MVTEIPGHRDTRQVKMQLTACHAVDVASLHLLGFLAAYYVYPLEFPLKWF